MNFVISIPMREGTSSQVVINVLALDISVERVEKLEGGLLVHGRILDCTSLELLTKTIAGLPGVEKPINIACNVLVYQRVSPTSLVQQG